MNNPFKDSRPMENWEKQATDEFYLKQFTNEYQNEFYQDSYRDKVLNKFAIAYCYLTEKYDRSICTGGFKNGSAMPMNGTNQQGKINRYARETFEALFVDLWEVKATRSEFLDRIRQFNRYGFEELEQLFKKNFGEKL